MRIRTSVATAATAIGLLAIATPVAGASAATTPAASGAPSLQPPAFTFVPPTVGPLSVDIGRTIINGEVTDPGLHVLMPPVTLPPMSWPARG
ncbi:MAG: hypothetical protein JWO02_722 [Solirubrobacterales bacterium]|nr:hypothetical protein [Solirubrobacterales bacterium]